VTEAYVRQELARLNAEMKPHEDALAGYRALIKAIQQICPHKNTEPIFDGNKCKDCGWTS
jgi:hypothetical protein